MRRSVRLNYEQYREIRPQHIEVRVEDGVTHVIAQLTEEQMKLFRRNEMQDYSIANERIEFKVGEGFVIEVPEEES